MPVLEIGFAISYNESLVVFPYQLAPYLLTIFILNGSTSPFSSKILASICTFKTSEITKFPAPPSSPKTTILFTLHSKFIGDSKILLGVIKSDFTSVSPDFSNSFTPFSKLQEANETC